MVGLVVGLVVELVVELVVVVVHEPEVEVVHELEVELVVVVVLEVVVVLDLKYKEKKVKQEKGFIYWEKWEDQQISNNFWLHEFICKCLREHTHKISIELINKMQQYRDYLNSLAQLLGIKKEISIKTTSAFRCIEHNKSKAVKGSKNSLHLSGLACDFKVRGFPRNNYLKLGIAGRSIGFTGVVIYDTFLHLDVRDGTKHPFGFAFEDRRKRR